MLPRAMSYFNLWNSDISLHKPKKTYDKLIYEIEQGSILIG